MIFNAIPDLALKFLFYSLDFLLCAPDSLAHLLFPLGSCFLLLLLLLVPLGATSSAPSTQHSPQYALIPTLQLEILS